MSTSKNSAVIIKSRPKYKLNAKISILFLSDNKQLDDKDRLKAVI
jgi:hypothetical protein